MDALAAGHDDTTTDHAAVQMIDTSVVRVHQHGACIAYNNHQDMGRSRGGLTSKIHAVGTPMACRSISLLRRVKRMTIGCVRFFSAPCFHKRCYSRIVDTTWTGSGEFARQQGAWANIPPKRNRKDPICFSAYLYRARNLIERFFNKINQCRRGRDPVRQTRSQLSGVHQARINPNLATR
jgi:hypothetical protein